MNSMISSGFNEYKIISQDVNYIKIQETLKLFGEKIELYLKQGYHLFGDQKMMPYGPNGSFTIMQTLVK